MMFRIIDRTETSVVQRQGHRTLNPRTRVRLPVEVIFIFFRLDIVIIMFMFNNGDCQHRLRELHGRLKSLHETPKCVRHFSEINNGQQVGT